LKTMLQIASELGIDKQKVYRYIKKHNIKEVHQDGGALYYNEAVETEIKQYFSKNTVSSEVHRSVSEVPQSTSNYTVTNEIISMLKNELATKDKQIDEQQQTIKELTATIRTQAESINAAHHNELAETIIDSQALPSPAAEKVSLWSKLFRKK